MQKFSLTSSLRWQTQKEPGEIEAQTLPADKPFKKRNNQQATMAQRGGNANAAGGGGNNAAGGGGGQGGMNEHVEFTVKVRPDDIRSLGRQGKANNQPCLKKQNLAVGREGRIAGGDCGEGRQEKKI